MKHWKDIDGWFNFPDVYLFLLSSIKTKGVFVECGAWLGKSSAFLCDSANNDVDIFIVDHWQGSPEEVETHHSLAKTNDVYSMFLENMGDRKFTPIKKSSIEAAESFADGSCDIVFLDTDHSYNALKKEILAWLPKVKPGGYLAGHDYNNHWPGVVSAVNEHFGQKTVLKRQDCWIYKNE